AGGVTLALRDVEPAYYTGLEIATSPGAGLMIGGMSISALGLVLLYMFNLRMITGYLDPRRLVMCSEGGRLSVSARAEFEKVEKEIREKAAAMLAGGGQQGRARSR
ncbi:MAG TPA: hypothetical protein VLA34_02470, partial [Candidatus Krumholzibacterium sp.]|nr:hypothetical protein [Candidatus Krumholzibacterium sp.]